MHFVAKMFALVKGAVICGLALLLLLTPVCGAVCHSEVCDAHQPAAKKSACHESASTAAGDSANGSVHPAHPCTFRELPVALPAGSRAESVNPVNLAKSAHGAAPIATLAFAHSFEFLITAASPGISRSQSPHAQPVAASSAVLRI